MIRIQNIKTVILDSDYKEVEKKFNENVRKSLKNKIEKKRDEINYVSSFSQAKNRFYKSFSNKGKGREFAELKFDDSNKQYRGIFLVDGKTKSFIFIDLICKENNADHYRGSRQSNMLDAFSNDKNLVKNARDKCLKFIEN